MESNKKLMTKSKWRLFYNKTTDHRQGLNEFISCLHVVCKFESIDELYQSYVFLKKPSELRPRDNFMVFRDNLIPAWEVDTSLNFLHYLICFLQFFFNFLH